MIEEIYTYFTMEMIYLWLNIAVLPFWVVLIFFPNSKICNIFTISIFPILIFSTIYIYLIYSIFKEGYDFLVNFELYLGIDQLKGLLSNTSFLILFWIHFLSINLFCGAWIVNDSQKFYISKILIFLPLITTYFIGPLGLFIYWIIRIFYAKRISFYN
tara:strand:- start:218 stop:691 length:474 start_codon:yes stop_codon:yes gene_type:complete